MHWMDALALRFWDANLGETPHEDYLWKLWVSPRVTLVKKNGVNWNISLALGKDINRDSVSSGERTRIRLFREFLVRNRLENCAKEGDSPVLLAPSRIRENLLSKTHV